MKNFLKKKMFKRTSLGLLLAIVMIGGVFVYRALANVGITQATGGGAVSIDTTSNTDCTGTSCNTWTNISGLIITEAVSGDIATGLHTLTLPTGWEFDTNQDISLSSIGNGLALSSWTIRPATPTTFNFTVSTASTAADKLIFITPIRVRPTNKAVATGYLTLSAGTIAGVALNDTPFATLTTVAGMVSKLAVTGPTNTVYGSNISSTVVNTQDQFGNNSIVGLTGDKTVSLVSSAGTLSGTFSGAANSGNNGTITFSDLKIDPVATGYTLTASADGLTPATSSAFAITAKPLTISGLTATSKTYDKTTDAAITGTPGLVGIVSPDDVSLTGTVAGTFDTKDFGTGKTVTVSGLTLAGTNATNYSLTPLTLTADINKVALTVTGAVSVSKTYNGDATATADFMRATLVGVLTPETVGLVATGYGAAFDNKNVGTGKTVTISGLTIDGTDAGNYTLTQPTILTDGAITQAAVTVTADSGQTKVYGATDPTLTFTNSPALISGDSFTGALARATGEDVGTTYAIGQGTLANGNYLITFVPANFAITAKPITVTPDSGKTKVYGATDPVLNYYSWSPALVGTDSFSGAFSRVAGEDAGNYAITQGSVTAGSNYAITLANVNFSITKATPVITWASPSNIAAGTALSGAQLNATATGVSGSLAGTFVYTPASGAVFTTISTQVLSTAFTPTDTTNYNLVSATTSVNIIPAAAAKIALSASSASLAMGANSTLTTTVQDQYGNTVTSDDSSTIVLSTDNGGTFPGGSRLISTDGVAITTITKATAGDVRVNATRDTGGLTSPATLIITFVSTADETNPIISNVSSTTAQTTAGVTFQSNEDGQGRLAYSTGSNTPITTDWVALTSATPVTINLASLTCGTAYNYSIYAKDGSSNNATASTGIFTTVACTEPTGISSSARLIKRIATKNGAYADGWKWILDVTLPTASSTLQLSFDNLTGAGTIPASSSIRFYSAQFVGHTATSTAISVVSPGAGTAWSDAITLSGDTSSNSGRQIEITVEAAVPSSSPDGYYSASYDLR